VIAGPTTYLLGYDEDLQVFSLSCGNPKTDVKIIKDVYLRVLNNKVSDTVDAETKDLVPIQIKLSYRLNFIDDSSKWFNVDNYVKFLTDRFRSIISAEIKNYTINQFYADSYTIIRKIILGEDLKKGYLFIENNVYVYDTEVVNVSIKDANIAKLLVDSQQSLIQENAILTKEKSKLEITKFLETIKQETANSQNTTQQLLYSIEMEQAQKKLELATQKVESDAKVKELELNANLKQEELTKTISELELQREKAAGDQGIYFNEKNVALRAKELESEIRAITEKAKAITPDLISALQSFSDKEVLQKVAESMAPLAILGGESVADVFSKMLKGTKLEGVFLNIGNETAKQIIPRKQGE